MRVYKVQIKETVGNKLMKIETPSFAKAVRLQAIFYGSETPSETIHFFDADNDEFYWVTGQQHPRTYILDAPITVKLPIMYMDGDVDGENKLMLFGEIVDNVSEKSIQ